MYPSSLSDEEFAILGPLLPPSSRRGRPATDPRRILDAIFYLVKTGCQWRHLPKDFPPWQTVYGFFRKWRWFMAHEELRRILRKKMGRHPEASAGIIDSQSVKTTLKGGIEDMMEEKK